MPAATISRMGNTQVQQLEIHGGKVLNGTVEISGSKNGSLPILFASILAEEPVTLRNVPPLSDIHTTLKILSELGLSVESQGEVDADGLTIRIAAAGELEATAPYDMVRRMRASICCLGPLLARQGRARVSLPGGCAIGDRPVDLHLKGLRALGADIRIEHGYIEARADRLVGATTYLSGPFGPTVLGTANVMMAASRAEGVTTIEGAACEPEIRGLARFLQALGVPVEGAGTHQVRIEGQPNLRGADFTMPPDRIEAGTYILTGALAGGEIRVEGCDPSELRSLFDVLERMGVPHEIGEDYVIVTGVPRLKPVDVATLPFPGFPTDLQAQLMAVLTRAQGIGLITEKVYPDRFMHVAELNRLGARIRKEGPTAIIDGGHRLSGADVMASDLRASASLVMAGLIAEGTTRIHRIYHLDRGYVNMEKKLNRLGAKIERIHDESGV